jgi:hypothetical protein
MEMAVSAPTLVSFDTFIRANLMDIATKR